MHSVYLIHASNTRRTEEVLSYYTHSRMKARLSARVLSFRFGYVFVTYFDVPSTESGYLNREGRSDISLNWSHK